MCTDSLMHRCTVCAAQCGYRRQQSASASLARCTAALLQQRRWQSMRQSVSWRNTVHRALLRHEPPGLRSCTDITCQRRSERAAVLLKSSFDAHFCKFLRNHPTMGCHKSWPLDQEMLYISVPVIGNAGWYADGRLSSVPAARSGRLQHDTLPEAPEGPSRRRLGTLPIVGRSARVNVVRRIEDVSLLTPADGRCRQGSDRAGRRSVVRRAT